MIPPQFLWALLLPVDLIIFMLTQSTPISSQEIFNQTLMIYHCEGTRGCGRAKRGATPSVRNSRARKILKISIILTAEM